VEPTGGHAPFYHCSELDAGSKFLRAQLHAAAGDSKTHFLIPQPRGELQSAYAYVAYTWVMVDPQRPLEPAGELPDRVPTEFAELSSEVLDHTDGGEQETLQVGRVEEGGGDPAAALFVVMDEERPFQVFPRGE
jgi:hypothetical protein